MEILLNQIRSLPSYQHLLTELRTGEPLPGLALPRAARLPVLAALHSNLDRPILLVTDRADHALQVHDELAFWAPHVSRYIFSEPNPLFYEDAAWGSTTRRERLQTLTALAIYHLPFAEKPSLPPIIVTSARALMTRTLPRRDFLKASKQLKIGQSISLNSLLEEWVRMGYQPSDTVLGVACWTSGRNPSRILSGWISSATRLILSGASIQARSGQLTSSSLFSLPRHANTSYSMTPHRPLTPRFPNFISPSSTHLLPAFWIISRQIPWCWWMTSVSSRALSPKSKNRR
jgi:hypothetical protein